MKAILWKSTDNSSLEYFSLAAFALEGTIILLLKGLPARITYRIECDRCWKTRNVSIHQERAGKTTHLTLKVDSKQMWKAKESAVAFATGMYDIDLEVTPATNTIPIRRIRLKEGESQQVDAVWVRFPSLKLERLRQRYTRIDRRHYKYESLSTGFKAHLEVDKFGLIVSYGNLWRRVAAK
jgi:hypothetical protein